MSSYSFIVRGLSLHTVEIKHRNFYEEIISTLDLNEKNFHHFAKSTCEALIFSHNYNSEQTCGTVKTVQKF